MRVGDVDGRDVVYRVLAEGDSRGVSTNYAGDLMLEEGEKISAVFPDAEIGLTSRVKKSGIQLFPAQRGNYVQFFSCEGTGSLFVTDRRVVFLRRPEIASIRRAYGSNDYTRFVKRVLPILAANALEYCEVRLEDVSVLKPSMTGSSLKIVVKGQSFRLKIGKEETKALTAIVGQKRDRSLRGDQ